MSQCSNQYPGYVKLPLKPEHDHEILLDFNAKIRSGPAETILKASQSA